MEAIKLREQDYCAAPFDTQERIHILGELAERRKHGRLSHRFSVRFCKVGLYFPIGGVTDNFGPCGAYIRVNKLHTFQLHDQIILTLFLPSSFSGQEKTIGLQGPARIIRLAGDNGGVAVKFSKPLKQFERTNNQE